MKQSTANHSAPPAADTIVAVSTAAGDSARAIVRLSGPESLSIVRTLLNADDVSDPTDRTYRSFDAALTLKGLRFPARLYLMRAPASYTREDVVEIHTFGNHALLRALVEEFIRRGARPAGPGEFTRRAFLNGRLDLAQAEAVEALIRARDEGEYRAALGALEGGLARAIASLREEMTELAALIELSLDFADQDVEILSFSQAVERLAPMRCRLAELVERRDAGRVTRTSIRVLFFGPPNAGKSSLFNRILNENRAIVSPHPGTTRDTIEASTGAEGLDLLLVDTAGVRPPLDEVEALAVNRSRQSLRQADIALCVLDASALPGPDACEAVAAVAPSAPIFVLNKSDLGPCRSEWAGILPKGVQAISVSAVTGAGIGGLLEAICARVESGRVDRAAGGLIVSARQDELLHRAHAALERAADSAEGQTMELLAADLREALQALAECTGGSVTEEVLDRIFSDFCIGK